MRAVIRDIWEYTDTHWIVVPANLQGPMGRGLAQQAKEQYPGLEESWKEQCRRKSIDPVAWRWCGLILFPVKYRWREQADLSLVEHSLEWLSHWVEPTALPQIGCGFGERDWDAEVEPLVEKYLEGKDNFLLVIAPGNIARRYPRSFRPAKR